MVAFEAKTGWKRPRKTENKNYISVLFLPNVKEKIPKKSQKNSKNSKNTIMASFLAKIGWKMGRKR